MVVPLGGRGSCRAVVLVFFTTECHGRTRKNGTVVGVASRVEQMWLVPVSATERSSRMMVVPLGGRGSCRAVVLVFFHHGRTRKDTEEHGKRAPWLVLHRAWKRMIGGLEIKNLRLGGSLALPNGWEGVSAGDAQPESNECAARNSAGVRTGQAPEAGKWRTFRLTRQSAAICNALLY